tara:strand:- start:2627 stop:3175 length:549 start_codon:yes stop_codon:yes gene_type:complete
MPLGAARFGLGGVDLGKLELIQTQTASGAVVDFTNLGSFNVHFVTFNDIVLASDSTLFAHLLSNNGGTSFITSGYHYGIQFMSSGGFGEDRGTTKLIFTTLGLTGNDTNETKNGYVYYYNLLDSSKFSFCTMQSFSQGSVAEGLFGSGVKPTAETHNAIRFTTTGGDAISSGTISLYGIKDS